MRLAAALATLTAAAGLTPLTTAVPLGSARVTSAPAAAIHARHLAPASEVCAIDDPRAIELSGLVVSGPAYIAINDSQDDADNIRILYIDGACKVTKTVAYPSPARDPEDLAVGPDGTLWVADIGDNLTGKTRRQNIALWKVPAGGGVPVIHRLSYPDGPHDAEALLFGTDGLPVIVTKETSGKARVYQATAAPQPQTATGVTLKLVGEFTPLPTGENNLLGVIGETMITGAATSPDRKRIALRTYTAAYEWDVPDGDVVKAITTGTPRVTALPDEPQGEAIAYSADGSTFLTVSDEAGATTLRSHVPSTQPLATPAPTPLTTAAAPKTGLAAVPIWYSVSAGVSGLALLLVGLLGLRRARRAAANRRHGATPTPLTE